MRGVVPASEAASTLAQGATVHSFTVELADVDRGVCERPELRAARLVSTLFTNRPAHKQNESEPAMQLPPSLPEPSLLQWLASNPTGIPRRTALLRAAVGTALAALLSLLLARRGRPAASAGALVTEIAPANSCRWRPATG